MHIVLVCREALIKSQWHSSSIFAFHFFKEDLLTLSLVCIITFTCTWSSPTYCLWSTYSIQEHYAAQIIIFGFLLAYNISSVNNSLLHSFPTFLSTFDLISTPNPIYLTWLDLQTIFRSVCWQRSVQPSAEIWETEAVDRKNSKMHTKHDTRKFIRMCPEEFIRGW